MPELPEMEALRRRLDRELAGARVLRAGPAHPATLKTVDPPLAALEERVLGGVDRAGKRLLFETDDGELVLLMHLMTAGRVRLLRAGEKGPARPAFSMEFEDGRRLVLTEAGARKRAGVWLLQAEQVAGEVGHLGPDALELDPTSLAAIASEQRQRLHGFLRDQRVISGIGRAWANEILHTAELSPFALAAELDHGQVERLAAAIHAELLRGLDARERELPDARVYRVHRHLGEPCPRCGDPIAQVDYDEHTIYYCPRCQTGGRVLQDRRLSRLLK